jgi:hypothetical protein
VRIILKIIATLHKIGISSTISKSRTSAVLDHVRWLNELSVRKALALIRTTARASALAILPARSGTTVLVLAPGLLDGPVSDTAVATRYRALSDVDLRRNNLTSLRTGRWRLETVWKARNASRRTVTDGRRLRWITVHLCKVLRCGVVTGVRTVEEVSWLVHVDPETIDIRTVLAVEEVDEELIPVLLGLGVKPIREDTRSSPDNAAVVCTIGLLDESVILATRVKSGIGLHVVDSRVNHDDVLLAT